MTDAQLALIRSDATRRFALKPDVALALLAEIDRLQGLLDDERYGPVKYPDHPGWVGVWGTP